MSQNRANKNENFFVRFFREHFIISNIILIFAAFVALSFLLMGFVNVWTHHGETTTVPDVRDKSFTEACDILKDAGLKVVISDSVYNDFKHPGEVVDVQPSAGTIVKRDREVFITIVSFHPEQKVITLPIIDVSYRQAESYLRDQLGIRNVVRVEVPAQYDDLVIAAKYNGHNINMGSSIPKNATVTLEVGRVVLPDSDTMSLSAMIDSATIADPYVDSDENFD